MTVHQAIWALLSRPRQLLVARWNWKSAVFSSSLRALVFLFANLAAGWQAATGAMLAEFLYRGVTAGFYGAITQAFGAVQPAWCAGVFVAVLLPVLSHSLEISVHIARGTPRIITSLISSVCFTIFSTLFNLYAMRRGALIVGDGARPMSDDLRRIPALIAGFVSSGWISANRWLRRQPQVLLCVLARLDHVHDGTR